MWSLGIGVWWSTAASLISSLLSKLKARSTYFENKACTKNTLGDLNSEGLLEKASIITTPTAYSDGVLHSVKPEQTLSELVTNGGFDTSIPLGNAGSGWNFIDSNNTGSSGEYYQGGIKLTRTTNLSRLRPFVGNTTSISFFPLETRNYVVSYDLISTTDSSKTVSMSAGGQSVPLPGTVGSHTVYFKNGGTSSICQISPGNNTDIVLDNISIKEVIDADFTFTRGADLATRVNASGNIESVGVDLPRIDYRGGSGSLLLEPQSMNLCSDYLSLTAVSGGAVTLNNAISPDGTQNATKVDFGTGSNSGGRISISSSASASTEYTFSFYAKNSSGDGTFRLRIDTDVVATLVNQTFTATSEWVRYTHTFTTDALSSSFSSNSRFRKSTTTDNNEVLFYGMQLEERSFATSVIPTSGSPITRGADIATDAGSSDLISSTEGVLYAEFSSLTNEDSTYRVIALSNGNSGEFVFVGFTNINSIYAYVGSQSIAYFTPTNATDFHKVAIKYEDNNSKLFINGVQVGTTNTNATVPSGLDRLNFDGGLGGSPFDGNVKCVAVFKEALTDAELTDLTTI
jgi:hypothetical protein